MLGKKKRDYSISFCRMVATISIVMCHIMQYFGVELAWWFNVGVQMFLFISGFLYARKKIDDTMVFYKKTFSKILLDYYIYIFLFLICYAIIEHHFMNIESVFGLLTFSSTASSGIRHFWFIPYILFCYFLTPVILKAFDKINNKNNLKFTIGTILILLITHLAVFCFVPYFIPAYIICFILGIAFGRMERRTELMIGAKILISLLALIMNGIQIKITYFEGGSLPTGYVSYAHVFLGIFLVMFLRSVFVFCKKSFKKTRTFRRLVRKTLDWSDKYSYDIYIVHQPYILGDWSIYTLLGGFIKPTIIVVVLIIVSAVGLRFLAESTKKRFSFHRGSG